MTSSTPNAPSLSNIPGMLEVGLRHHQAGHLVEAERFYRQVLAADVRNADALHLLGVIAHQIGRNDIAIEIIGKAIEISEVAVYHSNLGVSLKELGRFDEAVAACQTAIRLNPNFVEAHSNLGISLKELGRLDEAIVAYNTAIRLNPDYAEAHANLGISLQQLGRFDEAIAAHNTAIHLKSDLPEAHSNLGISLQELGRFDEAIAAYSTAIRLKPDFARAYFNLGGCLKQLRRFDEAIAAYSTAIRLKPDFAEAHFHLGCSLQELGRLDEAVTAYNMVISLNPDDAEAHANLGLCLHQLGYLHEAVVAYNNAIRFKPTLAEAHFNLGQTLQELGHVIEAIATYNAAVNLKPDFAEAHTALGIALLLSGELSSGWKEYEWRLCLVRKQEEHVGFSKPKWRGEDLNGRTILLHAEQGLGDTIQFCRYASLVADSGGRVVLTAPRSLLRLLSGLKGVDHLIAAGDPLPNFDFHSSLMSLPLVFRTQVDTIPMRVPYLAAKKETISRWQDKLGPRIRPRVGLVWNGGFRPHQPALHSVNERRNISLRVLAQLNQPHIDFFSLQKGEPAESELIALKEVLWRGNNFYNIASEIKDFEDTAGLIENLDLVISVDTSTAHLAGAMGKPVWVLNRFDTCWRWFEHRDDSPWYPTLRLFRQTERGDWRNVLHSVALALAANTLNER